MPKTKIPHVDHAKHSNGVPHNETTLAHAQHMAQQIAEGHYDIVQSGQQEIEAGVTKFWFLLKETDLAVQAADHNLLGAPSEAPAAV